MVRDGLTLVVFYLNVVGYKELRKRGVPTAAYAFYLNVVGYKAKSKAPTPIGAWRFYLNVVGYKVLYANKHLQSYLCFI